jgi:hypothetical protein
VGSLGQAELCITGLASRVLAVGEVQVGSFQLEESVASEAGASHVGGVLRAHYQSLGSGLDKSSIGQALAKFLVATSSMCRRHVCATRLNTGATISSLAVDACRGFFVSLHIALIRWTLSIFGRPLHNVWLAVTIFGRGWARSRPALRRHSSSESRAA